MESLQLKFIQNFVYVFSGSRSSKSILKTPYLLSTFIKVFENKAEVADAKNSEK